MGVFFITIASLSAESKFFFSNFNVKVFFLFDIFIFNIYNQIVSGDNLHPKKFKEQIPVQHSFESDLERTSEFWMEKGQSILKDLLGRKENNKHAKNVSENTV